MTGPVVIGFTSDPTGADAVALGLGYAAAISAPVIIAVVHIDPTALGAAAIDAEWIADRRAAAQAVAEQAGTVVAELGGDRSTAGVEVRLVPAASSSRGLSELAEEVGAEVIVVGSSATLGIERHVFAGSTAARLLSGASVPVAVAPRGYASEGPAEIRHVAVAYVDSDEARVALEVAARLVAATSASMTVLTAVPESSDANAWPAGRVTDRDFLATVRDLYTQSLQKAAAMIAEGGGPPVATRLLSGNVVQSLADLDGVDLLVCGSRGYGPVRRVLLGGISSHLMRTSRNPVMVVPRGAA